MLKFLFTLCLFCISSLTYSNVELGAGFKANKIKESDKSATGVEFSVGKKYMLNENFGAKTSFGFSLSGYKDGLYINSEKIADYKFTEYTYGVSQRFYYNLPTSSLEFNPFVDVGFGYSRARHKLESIFGYSDSESMSNFYLKYGLGLQLLSLSGVGGELKYGLTKNKDFDSTYVAISFIYNL